MSIFLNKEKDAAECGNGVGRGFQSELFGLDDITEKVTIS